MLDILIVLMEFFFQYFLCVLISKSSGKNRVLRRASRIKLYFLCRHLLFKRSGFMNHTVGPGMEAFAAYSSKDEEDQDTPKDQDTLKEICDRSIFIEPVEWMKESIVAAEGKVRINMIEFWFGFWFSGV